MSKRRSSVVGSVLSAALLLAACGGESAHHGAPSSASGGSSGMSTTGGTGGSSGAPGDNGGTLPSDAGGSGALGGKDGVGGGAGGSSGSMPEPPCGKVNCPAIPTSCTRLVQEAGACCPTCLDTGCDVCPALDCAEGTHSERVPGDCCPSCVADPPDACATGQTDYATLRTALLEKYGSSGCSNSTDCTLVSENNACSVTCGVALPVSTAQNFTDNLDSLGKQCATCPMPGEVDCMAQVAACVNGRCVAVDPIGN